MHGSSGEKGSPAPASHVGVPDASSLPRLSPRQLGVLILFCSMSVLFTASIIGFWYMRLNAPHFRAPGLPDLPHGLLFSTTLIGLTSFAVGSAQLAIRKNQLESVKRWLLTAGALGALFLLMQAAALVRVGGGILLPGSLLGTVQVSGLLWCAAFGLYAVSYWPVLTKPRVDGRPG